MPRLVYYYTPLFMLALCLLATQLSSARGGEPSFLENRGQVLDTEGQPRPEISFTAEINGARHFYTPGGYSVVFLGESGGQGHTGAWNGLDQPHTARGGAVEASSRLAWRMDVRFVDANPDVRILPMEEDGVRRNYYTARQPDGVTGVRAYRRIVYKDLWDHIDAEFALVNGAYKYEFTVRPGGNPAHIRLRFEGAESMRIDADGRLHVATPLGGLREDAPVSFQRISGRETAVESGFHLHEDELRFQLGSWDRDATLVIDPWATYYGGSNNDGASDVVTDADGNVTVVGNTTSVDFPLQSAQFGTLAGGSDGFLLRFGPGGNLLWATYYGGSDSDTPYSLASDTAGNLVMGGWTNSTDLPLLNAHQSSIGGGWDAFVAAFDSSGLLLWATYAGGSDDDYGNAVATDAQGNVYLAGQTKSPDFPLLNPYQAQPAGGNDAVILKYSSGGVLLWSTLYGGSAEDYAFGVALRSDGAVIVGGYTGSTDFPTLNPWQNALSGSSDMFAMAFDSSGARLWAGYYGGSSSDFCTRLRTDAAGNAVLTGWTSSSDFPVQRAWQATFGGVLDAVLMKLDTGGVPIWAGYFGGSAREGAYGLSVTPTGSIALTGVTSSDDLPTLHAHQAARAGNTDAMIARFDSSGTLLWSTYYGGSGNDGCDGIAIDPIGNVTLAGYTGSSDLPVYNALQQQLSGTSDAMILHFSANGFIPVELMLFTGRLHDGSVHLDWQTAGESQNLGFEIQRSIDGAAWERVGFVPGSGTSSTVRSYRFTDRLEAIGRSTGSTVLRDLSYRLRQIDFDGTFSYSPVLRVEAGAVAMRPEILAVYPSPASTKVTIEYTNGAAATATLTLHDALGREVFRQHSDAARTMHMLVVPTAGLPAGSYMLSLTDGSTRSKRLVRILR